MLFTRNFITAMLKKVSKLSSLTCQIGLRYCDIWRSEPFYIEEVPHLYEHLKKFKVISSNEESALSSFGLGFLNPFKNLKEIDFEGFLFSSVSIGDAVCLLEGKSRNGEFSTLRLGNVRIYSEEELKNLLKRIFKVKKSRSNLKIVLGLEFIVEYKMFDEIHYLILFCEIIGAKTVKGLEISLVLHLQCGPNCQANEVKRIFEKYSGIRNFELKMTDGQDILEYIKKDGEKEQLLLYHEAN